MNISIEGGNKRVRDLLYTAAEWYITNIVPKKKDLARLNSIDISLVDHKILSDNRGMIYDVSEDNKCIDVIIELDEALSIVGLLMTLAHECIHIRQMVNGTYCADDGHDYYDSPLEKEALVAEHWLYAAFITEHNLQRRKWYFDPYYHKV